MSENYYILKCPHCEDLLMIYKNEINCKIFRHGTFKNNVQINPHESKTLCDNYINENLIYGCGKPFKIIIKDDENVELEKCDYI